jgi:hypothetical protein
MSRVGERTISVTRIEERSITDPFLLNIQNFSDCAVITYIYLAKQSFQSLGSLVSIASLARIARKDARTIGKAIKELEDKKIITTSRLGHHSFTYEFMNLSKNEFCRNPTGDVL